MPRKEFEQKLLKESPLANAPITLFNDRIPRPGDLDLNPYNFLILNEPNEFFGLHDWAVYNHQSFNGIFTWSNKVLTHCPNAVLFPFGYGHLSSEDRIRILSQNKKEFKLSYICGKKYLIEGHKLRHKIFNIKDSITNIPLQWYYTTGEPKSVCFENAMFHLAVENSRHKHYFTEKITDAFMSKTVPIYWGCSNLGDYFDMRGVITFEDEKELPSLLNSLTEEDYWSRKKYIEFNYERALYWNEWHTRLIALLQEIMDLNGIK